MFKIISILLLLPLSIHANDISNEELKLINKLDDSKVVKQEKFKVKPKRFSYTENNFATQKFTAVLKKGSHIQTLEGDKFFITRASRVLKAEEVSPGSPFAFLFNKSGKAVFICYSKDLERLNEVVALTPKKVQFTKEIENFKSIDNDQELLLNLLVSSGSHQYDIFQEKESLASLGATSELGLKNKLPFPMMIVASFNKISGTNLNWTFANLGLKLSHFWEYNDNTLIGVFAQAERTIFGKATLFEESISLLENRFSIGTSLTWKNNIFSVEMAKERLMFPSTTLLSSNGITNTDMYHTSLILKVGKQFEIDL
jgi:hypothetical protein